MIRPHFKQDLKQVFAKDRLEEGAKNLELSFEPLLRNVLRKDQPNLYLDHSELVLVWRWGTYSPATIKLNKYEHDDVHVFSLQAGRQVDQCTMQVMI